MEDKHQLINRCCYVMETLVELMAQQNPNIHKVYHRTINDGKNFGYWVTGPAPLIRYIEENKVSSFLDLGCGAGLLLKCIKLVLPNIKLKGIELNGDLYQIASRLLRAYPLSETIELQLKDILTLTKKDIKGYQTLFAYEPLNDKQLSKEFAENLYKIMGPDQVFVLRPVAYMREELDKVFKYTSKVPSKNGLITYRKVKNGRAKQTVEVNNGGL